MNSISKNSFLVNGVTDLKVGRYGLMEKTRYNTGKPSHLEGLTRGKIKTFSAGSARRLRETLFSKTVKHSFGLGSTLTVPWTIRECNQDTLERFAKCFKRFRIRFQRSFPRSSIVYRVELQKLGAPHIHAVCYISFDDVESEELKSVNDNVLKSLTQHEIKQQWLDSLDYDDDSQKLKAERHAVDFDPLDITSRGALYRYLCDHTSKRKQAQLGYPGKQWGIIGKDNLSNDELFDLPAFPNAHAEGVFWRMIKKLTRYRISDELRQKKWKRPPMFGCVYRGGNRKRGVIFVKGGGDAVYRCYRFAVGQSVN